jgi:hypothetical protein
MTRYRKSGLGVKSHRAVIENMIDAISWAWDSGLSLLLDQAVIKEKV